MLPSCLSVSFSRPEFEYIIFARNFATGNFSLAVARPSPLLAAEDHNIIHPHLMQQEFYTINAQAPPCANGGASNRRYQLLPVALSAARRLLLVPETPTPLEPTSPDPPIRLSS